MVLFHKDAFAIPVVLSCFVVRLSGTGYHSNLCASDLCRSPLQRRVFKCIRQGDLTSIN